MVFRAPLVGGALTELLYLVDSDSAYVRTFRARVTALPPGGVVLDATHFYPTGGGQPCDLGTLRGPDGTVFEVVDVSKSGPSVIHRLGRRSGAPKAPSVGDTVEGTIDWARRHRHMRSHTFQHLLSARLFVRQGLRTRKASLSGAGGYLELEAPWPSAESTAILTEDLRTHLEPARSVHIRWVTRAEYERDPGPRSGLVPLPPQVDPVRVVEIDAADRCPCGGTHLRSTGEVGPFTLATPRSSGAGARIDFTLAENAPPTPSA